MASKVVNAGSYGIANQTIDWANDTIKARLVASSASPTPDITSMTGLTALAADQTLGTKSVVNDTTNDRTIFKAASPTFPSVAGGATAGWMFIFKFVTNDADSIPLAYHDIADTPTNGGDIGVAFQTIDGEANVAFYLQQ